MRLNTHPSKLMLQWLLVGLLLSSSALFAVAAAIEHRSDSHHNESAAGHEAGVGEGEHNEATEHADSGGEESEARLFGIDIESPWIVALGVSLGVGLAGAVAWRASRPLVGVVVLFALVFAALDGREALHQFDEHVGVALLALVLLGMHLVIAGTAGKLAERA